MFLAHEIGDTMNNKLQWALAPALAALVFWLMATATLAASPAAPVAPPPLYVDDSVCPGLGSGTVAVPYCRIQDAIRAATNGGEIRVAGGLYTYTRVLSNGTDVYTYTQVAFITKSLKLRGSWASGWLTQSVTASPSVINPQGKGRGVTVLGDGSDTVTLEAFVLSGGDYTGLGNQGAVNSVCPSSGADCGGGLYARGAQLVASSLVISGNIVARAGSGRMGDGGGALLWWVARGSRIESTSFINNQTGAANSSGGGLSCSNVYGLVITGSQFVNNTAQDGGGGMDLFQPRGLVTITRTSFVGNYTPSTNWGGAGMVASLAEAGDALIADGLRFSGNYGTRNGSAIYLNKVGSGTSVAHFTNILLDDNQYSGSGAYSTVYIGSGLALEARFSHVTAADNRTSSFLHVVSAYSGADVMATLTNTLIQSATYAYVGEQKPDRNPPQIRHTNTLTYRVGSLHYTVSGTVDFQAINPLSGDPMLDAGYHLRFNSAARDAGVSTGVAADIDGELRTGHGMPDIGADEFPSRLIYVPIARKP
jgi:hypothetical protein